MVCSRGGCSSATHFTNCWDCEKRVPLWDELEERFASAELQQRVRELQAQSQLVLDSESQKRALVGEVISTVALAGQPNQYLCIDLKTNEANSTTSQLVPFEGDRVPSIILSKAHLLADDKKIKDPAILSQIRSG